MRLPHLPSWLCELAWQDQPAASVRRGRELCRPDPRPPRPCRARARVFEGWSIHRVRRIASAQVAGSGPGQAGPGERSWKVGLPDRSTGPRVHGTATDFDADDLPGGSIPEPATTNSKSRNGLRPNSWNRRYPLPPGVSRGCGRAGWRLEGRATSGPPPTAPPCGQVAEQKMNVRSPCGPRRPGGASPSATAVLVPREAPALT